MQWVFLFLNRVDILERPNVLEENANFGDLRWYTSEVIVIAKIEQREECKYVSCRGNKPPYWFKKVSALEVKRLIHIETADNEKIVTKQEQFI